MILFHVKHGKRGRACVVRPFTCQKLIKPPPLRGRWPSEARSEGVDAEKSNIAAYSQYFNPLSQLC